MTAPHREQNAEAGGMTDAHNRHLNSTALAETLIRLVAT